MSINLIYKIICKNLLLLQYVLVGAYLKVIVSLSSFEIGMRIFVNRFDINGSLNEI